MRCTSCHRNVAAGAEAQKMIVEYRQDDGSSKVFGYMMSDGPISAATGVMLQGWHSKCYYVAKKREARGDAVTGRVVAGSPTGYDIGQLVMDKDELTALGLTPAQARERSTVHLSARVQRLRALAEWAGLGVGDARVQEMFLADEHGGPYPHQHQHRLGAYQLVAHLRFAHGQGMGIDQTLGQLQHSHAELHAQAALDAIRSDRLRDGEPEPRTTDWREQTTADIE